MVEFADGLVHEGAKVVRSAVLRLAEELGSMPVEQPFHFVASIAIVEMRHRASRWRA